MIDISKDISQKDLEEVFEGDIPDCHPTSYINARLRDKMAFVAKEENKAIGFLIYNIWWGNCPFIELIKIKESHQRQEIGHHLLETAIDELKSKNYKELISSSEVVNDMGNNFHRKWGFKKINSLNLLHGEEQFYKKVII